MIISIKDYKNISSVKYEIKDNETNILFGLCGSGKTAISQAILCDNVEFNKKVDSPNKPEMYIDSNDPSLKKVSIFNEKTVEKYLFETNQLDNNIIPVLIDDENEYKKSRKDLDKLLEQLSECMQQNSEYYNSLKLIQKQLGATLSKKNTLSGKSIIVKAQKTYEGLTSKRILNKINELENNKFEWIVSGINDFEPYSNGVCPFCNKKINKTLKKDYDYFKAFETKVVQNLKLSENQVNTIKIKKLSVTEKGINSIYNSMIKVAKSIKDFEKVRDFVESCYDTGFDEKKIKELEIESCFYEYFPSIKPYIKKINEKIQLLIKIIATTKKETKSILTRKLKQINDYFKIFDVPYEINAKYNRGKITDYHLSLIKDTKKIDRNKSLSNGEKVIVSLILFLLENEKKDNDLIIIDDPVSSFDNVKRGLIYQLIRKKLNKKTVLILSHDSVFIKYAINDKKNQGKLDYIDNHNDVISVNDVKKEDVDYYLNFVRKHLQMNPNLPYYIKILNVRFFYELEKEQPFYRYLSRIIHCEDKKKVLKSLGTKSEVDILSEIEKKTGTCLPCFDESYYKNISIVDISDFEKACLLRQMDELKKINIESIRNIINDYVHINSSLIICLDQYKYSFCTKHLRDEIKTYLSCDYVNLK